MSAYDYDEEQSSKVRPALIGLLILALVSTSALAVYFYRQGKMATKFPLASESLSERELLDRVASMVILPKDEQPLIRQVQNAQQYQDRPVLNQAQNGDIMVVYQQASRVIIYRPADQKLVAMGQFQPVSIQILESSPSASPSATPTK